MASYILLNESIPKMQVLFMVGCLIGIAVLTLSKSNKQDLEKKADTLTQILGIITSLYCAFCFGTVGTITRMLKDMEVTTIQFHYGWSASLLCICLMILEVLIFGSKWDRFFSYSFECYVIMIASGACNSIGMLFAGKAMQ